MVTVYFISLIYLSLRLQIYGYWYVLYAYSLLYLSYLSFRLQIYGYWYVLYGYSLLYLSYLSFRLQIYGYWSVLYGYSLLHLSISLFLSLSTVTYLWLPASQIWYIFNFIYLYSILSVCLLFTYQLCFQLNIS